MKKHPCGGPDDNPDLQHKVTTQVETEDGLENVHVDMETGEVSYGPMSRREKNKAQSEAVDVSGSDV